MRWVRGVVIALAVACLAASARGTPVIVEAGSPAIGADGRLVEAVELETLGGVFTPVLERGCRVPCSSAQVFTTAADRQQQITISVFRGSAGMVSGATPLGRFRVEGIPPLSRGEPQVTIVFGAEGKDLTLQARDAKTGRPYRINRVR